MKSDQVGVSLIGIKTAAIFNQYHLTVTKTFRRFLMWRNARKRQKVGS